MELLLVVDMMVMERSMRISIVAMTGRLRSWKAVLLSFRFYLSEVR